MKPAGWWYPCKAEPLSPDTMPLRPYHSPEACVSGRGIEAPGCEAGKPAQGCIFRNGAQTVSGFTDFHVLSVNFTVVALTEA